jgi:hypothetical protein
MKKSPDSSDHPNSQSAESSSAGFDVSVWVSMLDKIPKAPPPTDPVEAFAQWLFWPFRDP